MTISFELQEEIQALQEAENYDIPHEHNPTEEDPERLLEAAVEAVAESSCAITDPEVFDVYRSLLKHSNALPGSLMSKLLDSISSGLQAELEATTRDVEQGDQQGYMSHKLPLELFGFLLHCKVLRLQTQRIWTTTAEREAFITCMTRPAYHVMESEQYMKSNNIKLGVYKIICLAVKHHGHSLAAQITIMQYLQFYEHLPEPMAECLTVLAKEFDHAQLGDEILREIAAKTFNAQDQKGPRVFARFIVKFADMAPRSILKQLSLLLRQLDSESYPMRVAIVEVIGFLIAELATSGADEEERQIQKQIAGLYDLLLERIMDLSSYVRAKLLQVLSKLCDLKVKFPKQRLQVTKVAVSALSDKVATVRKWAAALLVKLLVTHPYGLVHGGLLEVGVFEAEYAKVKEKLAEVESRVGKAVERNEEDEEEQNGDEEERYGEDEGQEEDEGAEASKPKKKKRSTIKSEDRMDVDGEEEGDGQDEDGGDTEEDEPEMSVDGDDEESAPKKKGKKRSKLAPRKSQLDVAALSHEQEALAALETNQILQYRLRKKYYAEALTFIREIEGAMGKMGELLGSTHKPEVLEAMEFFRVAYEYRFESAKIGVKKMLHLIWTKENNASTSEDASEAKSIRSRLLECYRNLYFEPLADPDMTAKDQVNRIAKNMIEQTYDATLAELTSLEEMVRIMMDEGHVHQDVINKLWQVYSTNKQLPKPQRRGAIIILGMLALAKRSVLTDRVDTMLKVGLGPFGKADLTLARYTCVALQRLNGSAKKVKGSLIDKTLRLEMENPIFRKLQAAIEMPCRSKDWFGLAEQAINTIYALGEHPDVLCNDIIKKLTLRAFNKDRKPKVDTQSQPTEKDPNSMDEDHPGDTTRGSDDTTPAPEAAQEGHGKDDLGDAFELSQLLFVVGHVAIKQIVFLELVEREWKRQKDEKQAAEKKAASNTSGHQPSKDGEELDQVAGNAEDEIGERIAAVRETELLYGEQSLLAVYGPMLVHVCGSPHKFKNRTLRAAATLSFSKFLCVSSNFCDRHHRLLFKILETSRDANIRSNIVIALGDVAVSFSNIIDENSNELYKGLSDKDLVVKKNTLMVLTHLILNGMIKVKGQLGEMAKCLEDPEPRIADLAKLFFKELSTKENAIYNNLPDVISHLSTGDHAVDEETFQSTLKYIFTFIEKEKQAENIVEKLCQRFRLSEEPRQWRDIAYCLSLLPYKSERSVKKLIEGLQFYRDKLHEEQVFERFQEILAKARSNKSKDKPDSDLDEFEKILNEHRAQGEEDQALEKRVGKKKAAAARKRAAATRKTRSKKAAVVEENDDNQYDD
ncbi:putative regulatory subunit of the condensin complex, a complex required for conversion of interphase chromatin into mitotic-like condense chromosomes [Lyophyllum shimeji]|uniref:Condensin complex subunit 1 n=1 Tax=Lyophyllum shimeji TaxID=47721 RepID=A0A9P3PVA9_LYOSH|nr:putative regulatory subunit of the condensin complex, a complex required for conversion of interphase chromatin into mitotic-like condense chromosomes [Lyophyllum shimeji]